MTQKLQNISPVEDACSCIRSLQLAIALYQDLRKPFADAITLRAEAEARAINHLDEITDIFLDWSDCEL